MPSSDERTLRCRSAPRPASAPGTALGSAAVHIQSTFPSEEMAFRSSMFFGRDGDGPTLLKLISRRRIPGGRTRRTVGVDATPRGIPPPPAASGGDQRR
jgi:hypothetical protein